MSTYLLKIFMKIASVPCREIALAPTRHLPHSETEELSRGKLLNRPSNRVPEKLPRPTRRILWYSPFESKHQDFAFA